MSPPYTVLKAGLTALGVCGFAGVLCAAEPNHDAAPGPSATIAPAPQTVLLLSNGRVLTGAITRDDSGYLLQQKAGTLKYAPAQVERTFGSIVELYQYKVERLPARDPDEQLKLARWCLTNHLNDEAKTHLRALLALSPKHREAESMIAFIEAAEARAALRDPDVARAGFAVGNDRQPVALDPALKRILSNPGLPRIFDLPPAQAVKRTEEFGRSVHPVLQKYCANCHDENYPGPFQLVPVKGRLDRSSNVFRANLDAVLRLVDPEDPSKSELLSSTLRPHGPGPRQRPIFTGSNDPGYQVLSSWVSQVRSPRPAAAAAGRLTTVPAAALPPLTNQPDDEGFATARAARPAPAVGLATAPQLRPAFPGPGGVPGVRYVPGMGIVHEQDPPLPEEFPVPFAVGGSKTELYPPPRSTFVDGKPPVKPATPPDGTANPAGPSPPPPKKPSKPVKIDDSLLERMLMNRNLGR